MLETVGPDEHSLTSEDDPADDAPVHFKDFDLESAVREELGEPEGAITRKDLASLRVFMAEKHEICDLSGLEYATNLDWLFLGRNQINDLTPLGKLTNLSRLFLFNNQISDVAPLVGLTRLERLYLPFNRISDITPLTKLTFLSKLFLFENPIPDDQKAMLEKILPSCEIRF